MKPTKGVIPAQSPGRRRYGLPAARFAFGGEEWRHRFNEGGEKLGFVALIHPMKAHQRDHEKNGEGQQKFVHLRDTADQHNAEHKDRDVITILSQNSIGTLSSFSTVVRAINNMTDR